MSVRRQLSLDLEDDEVFVVGFAGGGGSCTGYELATRRNVDLACNHDALALAMHAMNHPQTRHFPEDIRRWDLAKHTAGRRVGGAWYSPDCKHFSKAKGGKPKSKHIRGLAWVIIHEINQLGPRAPRVIFLENVEEFCTWGPLLRNGDANPRWKKWFFRCFVGALKRRGYHDVEWRELRACDYGAPTIRKRLYLVARRDGQPIVWPEPTHAGPGMSLRQVGGDGRVRRLRPARTAAEIIDWSIPCPSIFLTREEGQKVRAKRPLVRATCRRIAQGVKRFVMDAGRPFIVSLTHQGEGNWTTQGVDEPVKTITSANRGEKALVAPLMVPRYGERDGQRPRALPVDKPMPVIVPTANGGSLVAPLVAYAQHGGAVRPVDAPVHTITASKKDCNSVAACFVARQFGTTTGHDAREPLKTVMSDGGGGKNQAVAAYIAQHNGGMVGHAATEPVSTIAAKGANQAIVGAAVAAYYGSEQDGQSVHEPLRTVTSLQRFGLATCAGGVPPFTTEMEAGARRVAAFLREHGVEFEGEYATVGEFVIYDIGMRMFAPRELFRAQGFPDSYVIDVGLIMRDGRKVRVKLTKTAQIRMCGNSVCPPVAAALIRANLPEMSRRSGRRAAAAVERIAA